MFAYGYGCPNARVRAWAWIEACQQSGKGAIWLVYTNRWPVGRHRPIQDDRRRLGGLERAQIFLLRDERDLARLCLLKTSDPSDDQRRIALDAATN
jgi:hypothetical protein